MIDRPKERRGGCNRNGSVAAQRRRLCLARLEGVQEFDRVGAAMIVAAKPDAISPELTLAFLGDPQSRAHANENQMQMEYTAKYAKASTIQTHRKVNFAAKLRCHEKEILRS